MEALEYLQTLSFKEKMKALWQGDEKFGEPPPRAEIKREDRKLLYGLLFFFLFLLITQFEMVVGVFVAFVIYFFIIFSS